MGFGMASGMLVSYDLDNSADRKGHCVDLCRIVIEAIAGSTRAVRAAGEPLPRPPRIHRRSAGRRRLKLVALVSLLGSGPVASAGADRAGAQEKHHHNAD